MAGGRFYAWDDDPCTRRRRFPGIGSRTRQALWRRRLTMPRRVKTTILHGLQDTVIKPEGSWAFVQHVLSQDPGFLSNYC